MLIEKFPMIRIFKLITGEELISKVVSESNDEYILSRPLQVIIGQSGLQFAPISVLIGNDDDHHVKKNSVVFEGKPGSKLVAQYESAISGIMLPPTGSIIT